MIFGGSSYTGIDLGAWSVKAVVISGRRGAWSLKAAAYMKLPEAARNGDAAPGIVADFLRSNSIQASKAGVLMTRHSLMFRHFYLPSMPDKDFKEAVKWEIRKEVAIPPAELVSDFVTAESGARTDGKLSIIAFASVRKDVDSIMAFFKEAGVFVKVLEVVPTSLLASFCLNNEPAIDENDAMLDIGETKSTLAVFRNRSLTFTREISIGGQDFTRAAALHFKKSAVEAEENKHGLTAVEAREVFSRPIERLSSEVRRSFDYFEAQFRQGNVSKLFITGGTSRTAGIDAALSDGTGIPVFVDDPLRKLKSADEGPLAGLAPCFSVAMGLALRAAGGP